MGDLGPIPGLERSAGEGNGYSLQYSCLENPMDTGAWWASPWGRKELDTTERLSTYQTALSGQAKELLCYDLVKEFTR